MKNLKTLNNFVLNVVDRSEIVPMKTAVRLLIWSFDKKVRWVIYSFLFCYSLAIAQAGSACELVIDRVIVGDCEFGPRTGNASKVIVAVFLSWKMPPPGTMIVVKLKGQTKNFDPFEKGCPPYLQFILDPDGSDHVVTAYFNLLSNCVANPDTIHLPFPCDPPTCSGSNTIGGKVYRDYNNNGVQDLSEIGVKGIPVFLFDDSKQLIATTNTQLNGIWAIPNLTSGLKVRVEFQIPNGLYDSNVGTDCHTRTQRAIVGDCKVNLGLFDLQSVLEENPWIVTATFSKGTPRNPASNSVNNPAIVANQFNTSGGGPRDGPNGSYYLAGAAEIGTIWGLAYQKETRKLFSAAFLKRNAHLGPEGLGAIYVTDLDSFLPNPPATPGYRYFGKTKLYLNLDSFGIQTGDETTFKRDIGLNTTDASHDSAVFDHIGKWGLADIDLNDRGDTLFAINMYNRSLLIIQIGNPLTYPVTKDLVTEINIPFPACSRLSDWRPWGLKYHEGSIFIGGVCSAESSKNRDDLNATIFKLSNGVFSQVSHFDLNYTKGFVASPPCGDFRPWSNNYYYYLSQGNITCGPVPILSDIEFDSEGNMIVAIGDRFGYQSGGHDFGTKKSDGNAYFSFAGGDLLKFFKLKDEFLLEKNGTAGFYTTAGANNNQGICGGEYFYEDGFFGHQESALGALAIHPSYNTVLSTMMDPDNIHSNGWSQMENSKGNKKVNYNLMTGDFATFGKATGVGDIELLVGSSTTNGIGISIGNFIWDDIDADGLQDPGELPVSGLLVLLFDQNGKLVDSIRTNLTGEYYFKNLQPETNYFIQLGEDLNYINGELVLGRKSFNPTIWNNRNNFGNIENDSDAETYSNSLFNFKDKIVLEYTTGKNGENNFNLDFGLIRCVKSPVSDVEYTLCPNDSIQVGATWFSLQHADGEEIFKNASYYGCDSTVRVHLNFLATPIYQLDTNICQGDTINLNNQLFSENNPNGVIVHSKAGSNGCDSLVNVQVHILKPSMKSLDTSVCKGSSVVLHQQIFDETNPTGNILLMNSVGCDSILTVKLNFLNPGIGKIDTSICRGSFIYINQQKFDEQRPSGDILLIGSNGCDSVLTVQLNFLDQSKGKKDTSICRGDSVKIHQILFNDLNRYGEIVLKGANAVGCDSLIEVQLGIKEKSYSDLDTSICREKSLVIHNRIFNKSNTNGNIILTAMNAQGCDSIIRVNVNLLEQPYSDLDTAICPGGQIEVDQQIFNETRTKGQLSYPSSKSNFCDSVVNVFVTVHTEYSKVDSVSSCESFYWPVNGKTYYSDTTEISNYFTKDGCDSIHSLILKIHPIYKFIDSVCTLNRYFWNTNNIQYKSSGIYQANLNTVDGCDSIRILYLELLGEGEVYIPNVFSPNGDGLNDKVSVFANKDIKVIDVFRIFDRWGEMMYELYDFMPNNGNLGWDGTLNGQNVNPAVFAYYVEWRDKLGGRHTDYGDVTLIR